MEEMGVLKTIEGYKNVWQLANDRLFDKAKMWLKVCDLIKNVQTWTDFERLRNFGHLRL